jgi:hypothetical protein
MMSFTSDFDPQIPFSPIQSVSRFDSLFDAYTQGIKQHTDPVYRSVVLIARSPASPPALALACNLRRLQLLRINVRVIFAHITPAEALVPLLEIFDAAGRDGTEAKVRWARKRALHDAHERLTLGLSLCWTGDAMRRSEDSKYGLDQVEDSPPAALAQAYASFDAIWAASEPLPEPIFCGPSLPGAGGAAIETAFTLGPATEPWTMDGPGQIRFRRH